MGLWGRLFGSAKKPLTEADMQPLRVKIVSVVRLERRIEPAVLGLIESGRLEVGQAVATKNRAGTTVLARVIGIETRGEMVEEARSGDEVGLLLADVEEKDLVSGDVLTEPHSGVTGGATS